MLPPNTSPMEEPAKYNEAKTPLASVYFSFGTSVCRIESDRINIERSTPWIILHAIRNVASKLKPAKAILARNIDIIITSTFFSIHVG